MRLSGQESCPGSQVGRLTIPVPRVNRGVLYTRDYEWSFAPWNLTYERNR